MAVPVRAELAGTLDTLGNRMATCSRRARERAGERFTSVARRLPSPDTLLGPQRQKLDDLGERLPRGLSRRLAVAGGDLARASGALRPRLLTARIERDRAMLARVGLRPALVAARITEGRARLEGLWRVAQSLNPDLVLQRGYARVEADGHVVASATRAIEIGAMTLVFADGRVNVATTDTPPSPTRPKLRTPPTSSLQPRLL
jgi:exodeoxyribonuclease VII large subunit